MFFVHAFVHVNRMNATDAYPRHTQQTTHGVRVFASARATTLLVGKAAMCEFNKLVLRIGLLVEVSEFDFSRGEYPAIGTISIDVRGDDSAHVFSVIVSFLELIFQLVARTSKRSTTKSRLLLYLVSLLR